VLHVVLFGFFYQCRVAGYVDVGASGFQRGVLGGLQQFVIARQAGVSKPLHYVAGEEAVEQCLVQGQVATLA